MRGVDREIHQFWLEHHKQHKDRLCFEWNSSWQDVISLWAKTKLWLSSAAKIALTFTVFLGCCGSMLWQGLMVLWLWMWAWHTCQIQRQKFDLTTILKPLKVTDNPLYSLKKIPFTASGLVLSEIVFKCITFCNKLFVYYLKLLVAACEHKVASCDIQNTMYSVSLQLQNHTLQHRIWLGLLSW